MILIIIILLVILFFIIIYKKSALMEIWKRRSGTTVRETPVALPLSQKVEIPQSKWLNVWVDSSGLIFFKIEVMQGKYYMTNSLFPGNEEIKIVDNKAFTINDNMLIAELEGNNLKITNERIITLVEDIDHNIPVGFYGVWKRENNAVVIAKPDKTKKNSISFEAGNDRYFANITDTGIITLAGKTGTLDDVKIKWTDGTFWEKTLALN